MYRAETPGKGATTGSYPFTTGGGVVAERDDAIRQVEARLAKYATSTFDRSNVPTTRPGIAALFVDLDRRLWVAHPRADSATSSTFTVYDDRGAVLFRVTLADDVVSLRKYRMR